MIKFRLASFNLALLIITLGCTQTVEENQQADNSDPLPSWTAGPTKSAIIQYVKTVTDDNSPDYISIPERLAVFDNDGTLWSEQPMYFQLAMAIQQVKEIAPEHPEWQEKESFKAILEDDFEAFAATGVHGILEIVMATHAGRTTEEFSASTLKWINSAKHPRFDRLYKELVYQPMLELLDYLRANNFKVFIVSGGGIDFMRSFAEEAYGIPANQIIGSSIKSAFEMTATGPVIRKLPEIDFIDDKEGKPVAINKHIGRRPVFCAGNSDGDLAMMQWTAAGSKKSFMLYVHHTDAEREWAYDRESPIGRFDKALDYAQEKQWTIVDMKNDWQVIYPFDRAE